MRRRPRQSILSFFRSPFARLRIALVLGAVLLIIGTLGYREIEHFSLLDAVYMTVITLSTVGYETVHPLDSAGKVFTIVLILGGIGTAAWAFTTVIEVFVSEQVLRILARKRMDGEVKALHAHCIVCGYGRIGQQIAVEYQRNQIPFVVIERDEPRLEMLRTQQVAHVEGDAADDDALRRAGIARASSLIAVTPTDAINTFIVLSARNLRPDLFIVARADSLQNEAKLYRAGASKVVSPHTLGGRWMGITAINPAVTDFITAMTEVDHTRHVLREFMILTRSPLHGMPFGKAELRKKSGALVLATRRGTDMGSYHPNPPDDMRLEEGLTLSAIGSLPQLEVLSRCINPENPESALPPGLPVP